MKGIFFEINQRIDKKKKIFVENIYSLNINILEKYLLQKKKEKYKKLFFLLNSTYFSAR